MHRESHCHSLEVVTVFWLLRCVMLLLGCWCFILCKAVFLYNKMRRDQAYATRGIGNSVSLSTLGVQFENSAYTRTAGGRKVILWTISWNVM